MSTTSKDDHWLELISQCRSSGLTDRQWCVENGIPVSTFYYHIRAVAQKMSIPGDSEPVQFWKQRILPHPLFYRFLRPVWKYRVSVSRSMNRLMRM